MASLKEVRNRIVSVSSTQQITSAMKMVSAAKLKRAQDAITQMRPYANKLREILQNLTASLDSAEGVFAEEREVKKVLLVVITSNRGLCGGFNANANKAAKAAIEQKYTGAEVEIMAIGKKAEDFFKKTDIALVKGEDGNGYSSLFDDLTFANVSVVAEEIMQAFVDGTYDKIELVYNRFKNAAVQLPTVEQFIPVEPPAESEENNTATDYIFEPSKEFIVSDLIPRSLKTQLFKALLDSHAAEHGARMTSMHKATDNAGALIKDLKLQYNKARQAAITNEILEIVGGAEALNN